MLRISKFNGEKASGLLLTTGSSDGEAAGICFSIESQALDITIATGAEASEPSEEYHACLGLLSFERRVYLVLVDGANPLGSIDCHAVHQITAVAFLDVESGAKLVKGPAAGEDPNDMSYLAAIGTFLAQGCFYFSHTWDLSRTAQSNQAKERSLSGLNDFVWNGFLLEPIRKFLAVQDDETKRFIHAAEIFPKTVEGFVGCIPISGASSVWLISRVSSRRAGTRLFVRGLDDDGYVSNYVESETLYDSPGHLFSYTIIRGSVPVFWEQPGFQVAYNKINLTRSAAATHPAFSRHIKNLRSTYGLVHALNLLGKGRDQSEQLLSNAYEYHTRRLNGEEGEALTLTQFDLNQEIVSSACILDRLEDMFKLVSYEVPVFSYFVRDKARGQAIRKQKGVFRINCFDCLDRTNIAMSFISLKVLDIFARNYTGSQFSAKAWAPHLNELWVDNGDQISIIYTGAGALKASITKHREYSIKGAMTDLKRSARRAYAGQFLDGHKNEVIKLVLGTSPQSAEVRLLHVFDLALVASGEELPITPTEQHEQCELKVLCVTWNVGGMLPAGDGPFKVMLGSGIPDVFAVAFQEIVELNPSQIISVDPERRLEWERFFSDFLAKSYGEDAFSLVVSNQLVGTTLSLFAKNAIVPSIRNVEIAKKMTGLGGMAGNKGSVAVWLDYCQKTFCFVASHFAAGTARAVLMFPFITYM